jgi:hypothetical protein
LSTFVTPLLSSAVRLCRSEIELHFAELTTGPQEACKENFEIVLLLLPSMWSSKEVQHTIRAANLRTLAVRSIVKLQ